MTEKIERHDPTDKVFNPKAPYFKVTVELCNYTWTERHDGSAPILHLNRDEIFSQNVNELDLKKVIGAVNEKLT